MAIEISPAIAQLNLFYSLTASANTTLHFFGFSRHSQEMKNCFVCFFGLPRQIGCLGAPLHSFRKREVAAINQLFHSIPKIDLICLLSSFIHLRSQTNHTLGCLSSFLASCLWRAAPITNRKEKTIGPAKTAIPRSIPKLMELIFMGSLCPLNHLYHLIQPMLSLPFNHLYCIKY